MDMVETDESVGYPGFLPRPEGSNDGYPQRPNSKTAYTDSKNTIAGTRI